MVCVCGEECESVWEGSLSLAVGGMRQLERGVGQHGGIKSSCKDGEEGSVRWPYIHTFEL